MFNSLLQNSIYLKAIICAVAPFLMSYLGIKLFLSRAKSFAQPIRSDGPESHLAKKGTPTMGGAFIVLATILGSALFLNLKNSYIQILLCVFVFFSAIGLVDDLVKVFKKNSKGFLGSIKLCAQFFFIAGITIWLKIVDPIQLKNIITFPFGYSIILAPSLYFLFIAFAIVGSSNAVNLTDGLDGLVSVPAIINLLCLALLAYVGSSQIISSKLDIFYSQNYSEIAFFCVIMIGSILGFLVFNLHPAKIFMGDVGSLAIGSVLGMMAVILKQEVIFFIISLVFVAEAVSVILQVGSYKIRKKRIFLMSPLHHHFEKKGIKETRVVKLFWFASIVFSIFGIGLLAL